MGGEHKPHGAGKSSFGFVDQGTLFDALALVPGCVVADLGSGRGDYSIAISERIGPAGTVFAVDASQEMVDELRVRAASRGLANIRTVRADLNESIPVPDGVVDVCFIATTLHDVLRDGSGETALKEIARVLKDDGRFAVVEFVKVADGPGPPIPVRLAPEETADLLAQYGFTADRPIDLGPYLYLIVSYRSKDMK